MSVANRKLALVIVWALLSMTAVALVAMSKLETFDARHSLYALANSNTLEQSLGELVSSRVGATENLVVHFASDRCFCQVVGSNHLESVHALAIAHQQRNLTINLDNAQGKPFRRYIPATPAVAVFDQAGQLTYLGPYSTGMYCRAGNGLVEAFIRGDVSTQQGVSIPFDARGCYCPTA